MKNRYQKNLESMKGGDYVHLLYYKCHRIHSNCGESNIDSPDWLKNKKSTVNFIDKKDKHFQYAVTVTLNYQRSAKHNKN